MATESEKKQAETSGIFPLVTDLRYSISRKGFLKGYIEFILRHFKAYREVYQESSDVEVYTGSYVGSPYYGHASMSYDPTMTKLERMKFFVLHYMKVFSFVFGQIALSGFFLVFPLFALVVTLSNPSSSNLQGLALSIVLCLATLYSLKWLKSGEYEQEAQA